jgi:hypothetical protein
MLPLITCANVSLTRADQENQNQGNEHPVDDSRAKSGNEKTKSSSQEGTNNPVKNTLVCIPQIPLHRKQKSA